MASTISFDRDEVSGPLRSATGTDGVVDIDDTYEEEIKEQEGAWTHKVKREHAQHTKVRTIDISLSRVMPFQPVLRPCSPAFLKGFLHANCGVEQVVPVSQCTSSDRFCVTPKSICTRFIRSHSLRPQPVHNTEFIMSHLLPV